MGPHDEFLELCAVSTSGELTQDERKKLDEHLAVCPSCRKVLEQYRATVHTAISGIASELPQRESASDLRWSPHRAEAALFERIEREERSAQTSEREGNQEYRPSDPGRRAYVPSGVGWGHLWMPYAAGIIFTLALGITAYRIETRHAQESIPAASGARIDQQGQMAGVEPAAVPGTTVARAQELSDAGHEREWLLAQMAQRDKLIAMLQRQIDQQSADLTQWKTKADEVSASRKSGEQDSQAAAEEKSGLMQQSAVLQTQVGDLQKQLSAEQQELSREEARRTASDVKVAEQEAKIDQQQELLAHDRDIRELMGARDLYVAEVYDVAKSGQTNKPYGRVFYTKGKSLVFYAYDLDQQPALKNASSFQAWGRRGGEKEQALNLGVFYEDSVSKKRWILKFDDPKALAEIDAVFVTVEPDGGSQRPSGKRLLFAYLRIDPNHP